MKESEFKNYRDVAAFLPFIVLAIVYLLASVWDIAFSALFFDGTRALTAFKSHNLWFVPGIGYVSNVGMVVGAGISFGQMAALWRIKQIKVNSGSLSNALREVEFWLALVFFVAFALFDIETDMRAQGTTLRTVFGSSETVDSFFVVIAMFMALPELGSWWGVPYVLKLIAVALDAEKWFAKFGAFSQKVQNAFDRQRQHNNNTNEIHEPLRERRVMANTTPVQQATLVRRDNNEYEVREERRIPINTPTRHDEIVMP